MNKKILFILMILLAFGFQSVFAQEADDVDIDFDTTEEVAAVDVDADEDAAIEAEVAIDVESELAQDMSAEDTEAEESEELASVEGEEETEVEPEVTTTAPIEIAEEPEAGSNVPIVIRNNQYYLESLKQADLAKSTYDEGDYDASTEHAAEAIRQAQLSDEYVALQLKRRAANKAITSAKQRLDWANTSGAAKQHPDEYSNARSYYDDSLTARSAGKWEDAYENAIRVLEILALFDAPAGALPAQYTVRTWVSTKDCLWNIAGQLWAYNDPFKWRLIYDANKSKLPEPENPNLIEPGMILTIPSAKGETRQGMWDPAKNYSANR